MILTEWIGLNGLDRMNGTERVCRKYGLQDDKVMYDKEVDDGIVNNL